MKRIVVIMLIMSLLIPAIVFIPSPTVSAAPVNWWNTNYHSRMLITIDSKNSTIGNLYNIPILVRINSTFIYDRMNKTAGARDFYFVKWLDNVTQFPHEVENITLNPNGGWINASIWVNLTHLYHTKPTRFWMYFNTTTGTRYPMNNTRVWNQDFLLVCHMNNTDNNSAVWESTNWSKDGIKHGLAGTLPTQTGGFIGAAQYFINDTGPGSSYKDQIITFEKHPGINALTCGVQVEIWAYLRNWPGDACIGELGYTAANGPPQRGFGYFCKQDVSDTTAGFHMYQEDRWETNPPAGRELHPDCLIRPMVRGTSDPVTYCNATIWINGSRGNRSKIGEFLNVPADVRTWVNTSRKTWFSLALAIANVPNPFGVGSYIGCKTEHYFTVGCYQTAGYTGVQAHYGYNGSIDEVRVYRYPTGDSWTNATYMNMMFNYKFTNFSGYEGIFINTKPYISNPVPANNSINIARKPKLYITASDINGDTMNVQWSSNSSGAWVVFANNNTVTNGTYRQTNNNFTLCNKAYYWKVAVYDGTGTNTSIFKFTTRANVNPGITLVGPNNGSTGVAVNPSLRVAISDFDGDIMNISWYSNSSGSWVLFGYNSTLTNGTYARRNTNFSSNGTTYYWRVNVTDGIYNVASYYYFVLVTTSNTSSYVPFTFTWTNTSLPSLLDVIDPSLGGISYNFMLVFTYSWTNFLGVYFFIFILGILGAAIYLKYQKFGVTVGYFIVVMLIFSSVMQGVQFIVGIVVAFTIGFLLYLLLVKEDEQ